MSLNDAWRHFRFYKKDNFELPKNPLFLKVENKNGRMVLIHCMIFNCL